MTFYQDYIVFVIDKRYEDQGNSGIIKINTAWINEEESERFSHKRLYGEVISVPKVFSDARVKAIDPGLPTPKVCVDHDWIQDKRNRGYTNHSRRDHYPSTFDGYEFITMADIAKLSDVRVGDRIYFDEKTTEPENYLGKHNGKESFKILLSDIFCVVRDEDAGPYVKKTIIPQGGWALIEPDMETWEDIKTKSGIIKKPSPEAKSLLGFIRHIRQRPDMTVGTKIIYVRDADWTIKVEGKDYYAIHEDDILCEA